MASGRVGETTVLIPGPHQDQQSAAVRGQPSCCGRTGIRRSKRVFSADRISSRVSPIQGLNIAQCVVARSFLPLDANELFVEISSGRGTFLTSCSGASRPAGLYEDCCTRVAAGWSTPIADERRGLCGERGIRRYITRRSHPAGLRATGEQPGRPRRGAIWSGLWAAALCSARPSRASQCYVQLQRWRRPSRMDNSSTAVARFELHASGGFRAHPE